MPISQRIDVHAHFLPAVYQAALNAAGQGSPDGLSRLPAWSESAALQTMDRLGIRTALLSISSPGVHFGDDRAARLLSRQVNEAGADLAQRHPSRFGFFASTPLPDVEGAIAEVRHALDYLKADGVLLSTNSSGMYLGDPRLEPLYAELDARGALVFVHPTSPQCQCCSPAEHESASVAASAGFPRPLLEFMFETTRTVTQMVLAGVLERHRRIRVLVPHAGAALPALAGRIELMEPALAASPDKPPVMRAAMRKLYFDLAGAPVPEQLAALLHLADPDKLLYGSDWPFTPLQACEALAEKLDQTALLDNGLRAQVMHINAQRIFPRLSDGHSGDANWG